MLKWLKLEQLLVEWQTVFMTPTYEFCYENLNMYNYLTRNGIAQSV